MIWMNELMESCTVRENIQKKSIVQLGGRRYDDLFVCRR